MNWIKIEHHNDFPRKGMFLVAIKWRYREGECKPFYSYHLASYDEYKRRYVYENKVEKCPNPFFEIIEEYYSVIEKPCSGTEE